MQAMHQLTECCCNQNIHQRAMICWPPLFPAHFPKSKGQDSGRKNREGREIEPKWRERCREIKNRGESTHIRAIMVCLEDSITDEAFPEVPHVGGAG